jgi:hypothetical protein
LKRLLLFIALCSTNISLVCAALDTAKINQISGLKGKLNEKEGVYKVTFPRNDVKVVVDGWTMPPFMALLWILLIATPGLPGGGCPLACFVE